MFDIPFKSGPTAQQMPSVGDFGSAILYDPSGTRVVPVKIMKVSDRGTRVLVSRIACDVAEIDSVHSFSDGSKCVKYNRNSLDAWVLVGKPFFLAWNEYRYHEIGLASLDLDECFSMSPKVK